MRLRHDTQNVALSADHRAVEEHSVEPHWKPQDKDRVTLPDFLEKTGKAFFSRIQQCGLKEEVPARVARNTQLRKNEHVRARMSWQASRVMARNASSRFSVELIVRLTLASDSIK